MNHIERLTAILLLIQEKPRTANEIAHCFEVSRRTVLRDVQALCEMGVPVIASSGPGGGYSLPESYTLEPLALSSNEAFLLLLALDAINDLGDAPHSTERASLAAKLRALLPNTQLPELERLLDKVKVKVPPRTAVGQRASWLDAVVAAAAADRWINLTYQSLEGPSHCRALPLEVYSQHGYWYCLADCANPPGRRTFRVDRILDVTPVEESYRPAPVAAPLPYDDPSHPEVRAELSPQGARWVEVEADLAVHLQPIPRGGAWLTFRCPPEELDYYARFFASLGREIRVLAPPELRERLRELGEFMAAYYAGW